MPQAAWVGASDLEIRICRRTVNVCRKARLNKLGPVRFHRQIDRQTGNLSLCVDLVMQFSN